MTSETSAAMNAPDHTRVTSRDQAPIPRSEIDLALTAQLIIGWAGEGGESPRLGWWKTDLASEFGGEDLFKRLLPKTWQWAVLQSTREAARRKDAELRREVHDPDEVFSLFRLGFEIDERLEDRFQELKGSGRSPEKALPGLAEIVGPDWERDQFQSWVQGHGENRATTAPVGRCIHEAMPADITRRLHRLVAALDPFPPDYPLPHFRQKLGETEGRGAL